jgi:hypothetical protein
LIPQDKANHEAYGARIAASMSALAVLGCLAFRPLRPWALLAGAATALASAWAAGRIKEWMDARANAAAAAVGEPPPHSVERADIVATARGGLSVALPLVVAGLMQRWVA